MGFIRHSFKRRIFFIIMTVTLILVVVGGILTIQGFQARIKSDHEKEDLKQEEVINQRIGDLLSLSDDVLNKITESEVLTSALLPGPKN